MNILEMLGLKKRSTENQAVPSQQKEERKIPTHDGVCCGSCGGHGHKQK